jgi:hypothetical protein
MIELVLRGIAYDTRSFFGSLLEWFSPLRLDLEAGFVHKLLVQLSAKFDQLGAF